jgi:polyhydroxyalkanoate synthase subunit PhaC
MADKRMQPTWDPIALAAQLRNIARQSQVLMWHFVSHQPDAIKFGMGLGQRSGSIFSSS